MCIFLSVEMMDNVVEQLIEGGYSEDTPVAIVIRASWPDQKILRGTLATIADQVREAGVIRQAMIIVGRVLQSEYHLSKLYDRSFSHMFRDAKEDVPKS